MIKANIKTLPLEVVLRLIVLAWFIVVSLPSFVFATDLSKHQMFELQTKLNVLGFDAGKPDGIFGRDGSFLGSVGLQEFELVK